jgi:outer membrane protein assembly factor BamA
MPYIADRVAEDIDTGNAGIAPDFLGINYYKYVRNEFDFRFYLPVLHENNLALRGFVGFGVPLFMQVLPFERRFFVGGSNSLRAWHIRELGPGGYHDPDPNAPRINTGDVRLEVNAEYRFPVLGLLKGAAFVDAGNVWTIKDKSIPEGVFTVDSAVSQIAVATGLGARLDFSFFVVRLDFAVPARLPYGPKEDRWVVRNFTRPSWMFDQLNLNVGIGYPF